MAMNWLRFLSDRFRKPKRLHPESLWHVAADAYGFRATDQTGKTMVAPRENLAAIVIETNDSGPWGADLWWLLYGVEGKLICGFPEGATGEESVVHELQSLSGFDNVEMTKAMGCTSNATFIVWRR
ncbi:MAG: hypothetical protein K2X73_02770 [Sphingomonas sp.]|uniref:hypothetical protein n=1 Tax=Sphingomonas sp. TaxID=28214 RepID=UPI0025DFC918|nr:hypothetical protein [Sphingomonas sp.]MBX9880876.1 hypothetical protein [Sphingomonas sp.]